MKLVTFTGAAGGNRVGVPHGDTIVDLGRGWRSRRARRGCPSPVPQRQGALGRRRRRPRSPRSRRLISLRDRVVPGAVPAGRRASLQAPIPRPDKIFLLAGNYMSHREEGETGPVEVGGGTRSLYEAGHVGYRPGGRHSPARTDLLYRGLRR